jgi:YVTN family beta-propeller protein
VRQKSCRPVRDGVLAVLAIAAAFGGAPAAHWGTAPCALTFTGPLFTALAGNLRAIVIDDACTHVYVANTTHNRIEDFSLETLSLLPPIQVGSQPSGLDFGPDNRLLYVANSGGDNVSVVDLQQRVELRKITVPDPSGWGDYPYSIAVAKNGLALLSMGFDGSGYGGRMMQVNLTTEQSARRTDFSSSGLTGPKTRLRASGDRRTIGIVESAGGGSIFRYASDSNAFSPGKRLDDEISALGLDIGGSVLLVTPGAYVVDGALSLSGTILPRSGWGGNAVSPNGTIGYRSLPSRIDVLNLRTFLKIGELSLGDTLTSADYYNTVGQMDISRDGRLLAVITDRGLSLVPTGAAWFIDDPLVAGVSPFRAAHITDLRLRADAQRTRFGLSAFGWTDPSLMVGLVARAVHISELQTAVHETYIEAGLTPPVFSESPVAGFVVKALHVTELRSAIVALESSSFH